MPNPWTEMPLSVVFSRFFSVTCRKLSENQHVENCYKMIWWCLQTTPQSQKNSQTTTAIIVLWPLYRSTCVRWHLQFLTGFCWCKVLQPACPCWQQLTHWDQAEDAGVLLSTLSPDPIWVRLGSFFHLSTLILSSNNSGRRRESVL